MFDVERILAIPDQSVDYLQCGIAGKERAALAARGFVRKDGIKAKDYMIRTIQKTAKNKAKAEKAIIKGDVKFSWNENIPWGENRKALKTHLEKLGVSTGDEGVAPDSYWKDRVKKLERAAELTKKDPKSITQSEFDEMMDSLPVKHPINRAMHDWQFDTLKDPKKMEYIRGKYGKRASLYEVYKNEVYSNPKNTPITPAPTTTKSNRGLEVTYNKKGDLSSAATAAKAKKAISGQAKGGKVVKGVKPSDRGAALEKLREQKEKIEDMISTKKSLNQDIPQAWLDKYSEVSAKLNSKKKSDSTKQGNEVYSLPVYGHPENHGYVKVGNKDVRTGFIPYKVDKNSDMSNMISHAEKLVSDLSNDHFSKEAIAQGRVKATAKKKKEAKSYLSSVTAQNNLSMIKTLKEETIPELYRLDKEVKKLNRSQSSPVAKKLGTPPKKKPIF